MILQLLKKELREVGWIAAVAMGLLLILVLSLMGVKAVQVIPFVLNGTTEVPFVGISFTCPYAVILFILAVLLGLFQSLMEENRGTYLFLLHRPASSRLILGTKLLAGIVMCLVCAITPILIYGFWVATPGNVPAPFEWPMTENAVCLGAMCPVLYLGAFLTGFRQARWLGSRLFPLISVGLISGFVAAAGSFFFSVAALVLFAIVLLFQLGSIAKRRDYA